MNLSPLTRYVTVASIVLVVGGAFAYRELPHTWGAGNSANAAPTLGMSSAQGRPALGEPAPDFLLEAPGTGELIRLSDLRGQPVLLNFWATWCGPCRTEMPDLQEAHDTEGVVVFAVNSQESDAVVMRFVEEFSLTFPTAIDRSGAVREHYGVMGLPATFFIDAEGILRARNFGPVYGNLLADGIQAAR